MANMTKKAKDELGTAPRYKKNGEMQKSILNVVKSFAKQGHSGASAQLAVPGLVSDIWKLLMQEPLSPLTGFDDEWYEPREDEGGVLVYQNVRSTGVFKDVYPDGTVRVVDINAVTFLRKDDYHTVISGSLVEKYQSIIGYIAFPYDVDHRSIPVVDADILEEENRVEIVGYYDSLYGFDEGLKERFKDRAQKMLDNERQEKGL